jgi:hypothetical protein
MEGNNQNNVNTEWSEKTEQIKQKASEIQEAVARSFDDFLSVSAEKLDQASEKIHNAAEFFRSKNAEKMQEDFSYIVRKNPIKSIVGGIILGFLIGRAILR